MSDIKPHGEEPVKVRVPFGIYRGRCLADLPAHYLRWLAYSCEYAGRFLRKSALEEWNRRSEARAEAGHREAWPDSKPDSNPDLEGAAASLGLSWPCTLEQVQAAYRRRCMEV